MQSLGEMVRSGRGGCAVGKPLQVLPRDTTIATTLIGTIGYYSGLPIVDQWGLVDRRVRDRPARRPFVRGHLRYTTGSEAVDAGADLYFEHPHLCECDRGCVNEGHEVLLRLDHTSCVRAFVTSTKPGFRELVCAQPARFPIAGDSVCPRSPSPGAR